MRKILLGVAALAAIATPIIATAGSANAATTDANGVITVAKGEIMAQFPGMNEAAFQRIAMQQGESLTGSDVTTFTTETTWNCSDGSTQHHYRNTIRTSPITFTEIYNKSADKVTGWTMTKDAQTFVENNTGGNRFPSYSCPTGYVDFSTIHVWTPTVSQTESPTFHGKAVSIAVNPYVAPIV
jgi:hypothetical protein